MGGPRHRLRGTCYAAAGMYAERPCNRDGPATFAFLPGELKNCGLQRVVMSGDVRIKVQRSCR